MAPNESARKIYDELFPGQVSTLAVTDPELIEYFDTPQHCLATGYRSPGAQQKVG
jgi:hypothetical protein